MMKPSGASFLITLILATAVYTRGQQVVKDTAGNPVEAGELYFIQPVKSNGGGLVPASRTLFPTCPLVVTQGLIPYQPGLPVILNLVSSSEINVPTYTDLTIEFKSELWPFCQKYSKLWTVEDSSSISAPKEPKIVIGGEEGTPSSEFKIEKVGEKNYKLTTSTGDTVGAKPGDWGGARQLVITEDPTKALLVRFRKVDHDSTTAVTSTSRVEKLGLRMFPFY